MGDQIEYIKNLDTSDYIFDHYKKRYRFSSINIRKVDQLESFILDVEDWLAMPIK